MSTLAIILAIVCVFGYALVTFALYVFQLTAYTAMANPTGVDANGKYKEPPKEFKRKLAIECAKWPLRFIWGPR